MKKTYIVTSIEKDLILAIPEHQNSKAHAKIEVINPNKLPVQVGSKISVGLPRKQEAITGLIALFTPIAAAVAGFFISEPMAELLKKQCTEIFKALSISVCFLIACAFILATSRSTPTIVKLQINEIL